MPRACARVNSRARLWGLGAQAHPWLLSDRDFLGLRCCLGSPVGKRQLSYGRDLPRRADTCGQGPARADACPPSPVGPCFPRGAVRRHLAAGTDKLGALRAQGWPACPPPAMGHHGSAAGARREHLPCFLLPRFPPGALCVPGGQGPPGKVWRNQPHALQMPAVGQDPGGAGGTRFPSRVCGAGPRVGTHGPLPGLQGQGLSAGRLGPVLRAGRRPPGGWRPPLLWPARHLGQAAYLGALISRLPRAAGFPHVTIWALQEGRGLCWGSGRELRLHLPCGVRAS